MRGRLQWPLAVLGAVALQVWVLSRFPFWGVRPTLVPAVAFLIGVTAGSEKGALWGAFGGLLLYLAGTDPWPVGFLALLGGLGGAVVPADLPWPGRWLAALGGQALWELLFLLGHALAGHGWAWELAAVEWVLSGALVPAGIFLLWLVKPKMKRKSNRPRRRKFS